jgi:uncharacterized protein (UPF0332 family)
MFTFNTTIDTVQNGKKQFVKAFVNDAKIADALNEFIDAQTAYTKQAVATATKTATTLGKEVMNNMEPMMNFDYSKFNDGVFKAYQSMFKLAK